MVKIEKVNKYFNRRRKNQIHVINNTSLELPQTGLVALLGASGSGKTTLLNAIGGLDKVNKGKIYINGKKITKRSAHTVDKIRNLNIGYIFQDYKLLDNLSVFENVAIALRMIGIKDKKEVQKRVNYVLESVNMYRYRNRPAKMLSGGERQRVSIARAIVKNPNIVIADEPTGNLDSKNSLEIMNIIKSISKDKLVILVTHEVDLAKFYASRIIEIQDGKVIKDTENQMSESLDYALENKIYLKDIKNKEKLEKDRFKINVYSENHENVDIKLVIKNGNIYIKSENQKVEVVDENSAIEFVDGHYQKIDKSIYQEYQYNIDNVMDKNIKPKYSSIYGIVKSIVNGVKKIANYSILKKILLIGFFASAMFIVYAISNIAGTINIKDTDFISKNKNYLYVDMPEVKVSNFLKYEKENEISYILPGDSMVTFKIKFDDYYQTSRFGVEMNGSLTSKENITKEDILWGKMPEKDFELVIDKMVLNNMLNNGITKQMGIKDVTELLNKEITIDNMKPFIIAGIVDKQSPSIYANKSNFVNILSNIQKSDHLGGIVIDMPKNENTEDVKDYTLFSDDITLKKGKMPKKDYEVIVNISNRYEMPLNKTINVKVNGKKLKVVGYYESKTNKQNYLVNNNTVKYHIIEKYEGFTICPKNKDKVKAELGEKYNLNIIDIYQRDKQNYIRQKEDSMVGSIIFALVILVISLIEIYLMIRSSFLSRIKEIGVLRAIGVKKLDIYRMFFGEIFAITTIVSLPGIIFMTCVLNALTQIPYVGNMYVITPVVIGISIAIIYTFNILIGLLPLFRVLRKTPAKILARYDVD